MAFAKAYLENQRTGALRTAPIGFSWTMFFFGFFAPAIRGDWKWVAIVLGGGILLALISVGVLGWVPALVGAFIWNKHYFRGLIEDGYKLRGIDGCDFEALEQNVGFRVPQLALAPSHKVTL